MNAEIIAIGSEMLTPARLDTNSLYLTAELNNLGVEVVQKMVVGDDRERLADAIRRSFDRTEIVILSGGLGPTEDDVTRDAVALALDRKLEFSNEVCLGIEERFRRMGRKMADINRRQAFIVQGADVLTNERGTAPGQWLEDSGRYLMLLPGPPHELKWVFERHCLPRLSRCVPRLVIRTLQLRVAGMGESDLDQLIAPIYRNFDNPVTTVLAKAGDVEIHFRAQSSTEEEAVALVQAVAVPVEALLGERVYSRNGDPLEVVVGNLLRKTGSTLAVAESCTGGMLAERITSVPGSSEYFAGGFVTYSNRLKVDLLGVSEELIAEHGAVSEPVAAAMAKAALFRAGATYALSVTGIAGPPSPSDSVPVGTVFLGLADVLGCRVIRRHFPGDRARVRQFAAQIALDLLRLKLLAR
ncbi:MAG: competence/damage-inducible protein A [Bryobacteraceae bacterium]